MRQSGARRRSRPLAGQQAAARRTMGNVLSMVRPKAEQPQSGGIHARRHVELWVVYAGHRPVIVSDNFHIAPGASLGFSPCARRVFPVPGNRFPPFVPAQTGMIWFIIPYSRNMVNRLAGRMAVFLEVFYQICSAPGPSRRTKTGPARRTGPELFCANGIRPVAIARRSCYSLAISMRLFSDGARALRGRVMVSTPFL